MTLTRTGVQAHLRQLWSARLQGLSSVIFLLAVSTHWVTVNISPSIPVGLYRFVTQAGALRRGDLVQMPAVPVGHVWPYTWLPLLKPVAGVAGDTVCVQPDGVWVEGTPYGPVYPRHKGQPLPVFWGCHVVGEGDVFLASAVDKSLDSRYLGPVPIVKTRRVVALWTWR